MVHWCYFGLFGDNGLPLFHMPLFMDSTFSSAIIDTMTLKIDTTLGDYMFYSTQDGADFILLI